MWPKIGACFSPSFIKTSRKRHKEKTNTPSTPVAPTDPRNCLFWFYLLITIFSSTPSEIALYKVTNNFHFAKSRSLKSDLLLHFSVVLDTVDYSPWNTFLSWLLWIHILPFCSSNRTFPFSLVSKQTSSRET